ncbi:MAG: hypothetical protein L0H84_08435 [Pseudonocardia sp.]|nr:hypothetical protein [Pseudonocardia sp.]
MERPDSETTNVMEQLVAEPVAMIERTRATARQLSGVYRLREHAIRALGPAVRYRRRTQDESDRKISAMVRETAEINGRMVRLMLDVDTRGRTGLSAPTSAVSRSAIEATRNDGERPPVLTEVGGARSGAASHET